MFLDAGANLGQVISMDRASVEIDAVGGAGDDLLHEQVGKPGGHGAFLRAGERPVEVATVRQVTGLGHETVHVDHGHSYERPP